MTLEIAYCTECGYGVSERELNDGQGKCRACREPRPRPAPAGRIVTADVLWQRRTVSWSKLALQLGIDAETLSTHARRLGFVRAKNGKSLLRAPCASCGKPFLPQARLAQRLCPVCRPKDEPDVTTAEPDMPEWKRWYLDGVAVVERRRGATLAQIRERMEREERERRERDLIEESAQRLAKDRWYRRHRAA